MKTSMKQNSTWWVLYPILNSILSCSNETNKDCRYEATEINQSSHFQPNEPCSGMTLSTLPPHIIQPNLSNQEQVLDMHLSLSSIMSNLFFMKMDWMTSRGLPCDGKYQMAQRSRLYSRLVSSWQSLACLYLRSFPTENMSISSTELQANTMRVIQTNITGTRTVRWGGSGTVFCWHRLGRCLTSLVLWLNFN